MTLPVRKTAILDLSFALIAAILPLAIPNLESSTENRQQHEHFAVLATNEGLPGSGPIRHAEWVQDSWREERRSGWADQIEADQNAVVFLGDSIVQFGEEYLATAFPDIHIANRGISKDTTRDVLIRLHEDVLVLDPTAVVLLIGTNDIEHGAEPETIAGNLQLIFSELEKHNATMPIILCQVFPSSGQLQRPAEKIKALNALYLEISKQHPQVVYLETWPLFADGDGDARSLEFPDSLHPNEIGYTKWAAALRPIFATLGYLEKTEEPFTPEPGFESLFNGHDLTGWGYRVTPQAEIDAAKSRDARNANPPVRVFIEERTDFDGQPASPEGRYIAKNGRLVVTTPPEYRKIQKLSTTREFPGDFVLKLEFRATPNADSGIFLRGRQLQCRDYVLAGPYKDLLYYRPQEWNEITVKVTDNVAVCTCNGEVLEKAFEIPDTGPIGLEGDRGQVEYRRIRIKSFGETL